MGPWWTSEQAFAEAVEHATKAATSAAVEEFMSQINRLRPIWALVLAALAGAIVSSAIAVPVTYVLTTGGQKRECQLSQKIAGAAAQNYREGIVSKEDFLRKSHDRLGLSPSDFNALIAKGEASQRRQLTALEEVEHTNC